MNSVTVLAPAKLNLTLDITGITENGYHSMDMIMQAVNLYETITVKKHKGLVVNLPGSSVPANKFNTTIKAALAFFDETGLLAGADITVHKKAPVRAGMAGGSADAAGVLVALNELYGAKMSQEQLCQIGAKVGADVPFAIVGGTARVTGIGEILNPIANCPPCHIVVCMPPKGISTPEAFARFDKFGAKNHPNNNGAQQAIEKGNLKELTSCMYNVLQECSESQYNDLICNRLKGHGALTAMMTGSGAAVFGIFDVKQKATTAKLALGQDYDTWLLRPCARGAHVMGSISKT